jgi:hypothetical protein
MTITIPETHRRLLEEHATRTGSTVDQLVARLIEEAFESDEVEGQLLKTVSGPPAEPMTQADWDFLYKRISDRPAPQPAD